MDEKVKGVGRAIFAAALLMIGGVLNIVWGIAAIGNSNFFDRSTHYLFGSLKTWGWITLILGVLEILAAVSLTRGGDFGRYFAIVVGSLAAIDALFDIPAYPFWSIAVFGLSLWIVYGLTSPEPSQGWGEGSAGTGPTIQRGPRQPV